MYVKPTYLFMSMRLLVGNKERKHVKQNSCVMEAQKEEAKGDWDEVWFIDCKGESHQPGSHVEKSNQEGIHSSLNHTATAGGQDPSTLATHTTTTMATISLLPPPAHFIFSGMTDRAMVAAWLMKKMTIALSRSFHSLQLPCPRAGYIDFGCLQPTPWFEPDYSITASTKT